MGHSARIARRYCTAVLCLAAVAADGQQSSTDYAATTDAVWMPQHVKFTFHGGGKTWYSCAAMREKIGAVLIAMGAHENFEIRMIGCGPTLLIDSTLVEVTFASPAPATDENVRRLTTHDTRDELVARLTGELLPSAETLERFAATWQTVTLAPNRKLGIDASECGLLKDLHKGLLTKFVARTVRESLSCTQSPRLSSTRLTMQALMRVP